MIGGCQTGADDFTFLKAGFDFGIGLIHQADLDLLKRQGSILDDENGVLSGFKFFECLNGDEQGIVGLGVDDIDGGIEADIQFGGGGGV